MFLRMIGWLALPFLVGAAVGCRLSSRADKDDPSATSARGGPVTVNWAESSKLQVDGSIAEAMFFMTKDADKPPLRLMVYLSDFPLGTKVKIGSESGVVGQSGHWSSLVDMRSILLNRSLDELKGKIDLKLSITLELPGAPPVTTDLPKQTVKDSLRAALLKAQGGGFDFGPMDPGPNKPRGVALLVGSSDLDFVGSAKTPIELDWVAIADEVEPPRGSKSCDFKDGPVTVQLYDAKVTIYERRSGKKIADKVVAARNQCPTFVLVDMATRTAKRSADKEDISAWVRQQLGPAK